MVMNYSLAKVQHQGSINFEDTVETHGRTDMPTNEQAEKIALPAAIVRSVIGLS